MNKNGNPVITPGKDTKQIDMALNIGENGITSITNVKDEVTKTPDDINGSINSTGDKNTGDSNGTGNTSASNNSTGVTNTSSSTGTASTASTANKTIISTLITKTGDNTPILFWLTLLVVSGALILITILRLLYKKSGKTSKKEN